MHSSRRLGFIAAFAFLVLSDAPAAAQPPNVVVGSVQVGPARDRVPVPRTGAGVIKGRVVDGASGAPMARARVRLQMGGAPRPSVLTDPEGAFTFTGLPPGPFTLNVEKSTYLPGRYPEQGRTIRAMARPATVADAQTLDDVIVKMYHGGAISGRVLDAHGDPVEYAGVSALRVIAGGRPQMRGGVQTNDLGEFRVPRLQAGTYLLVVSPRRFGQEEPLSQVEPPLQPVATYYPNALSADQAQPITLERGQSATGLDVVLAEGTPTMVTGIVVRRDGEAIAGNAFVNACPAARMGMYDSGGAAVRPDGTFRMVLHPGDYVIQATVSPRTNGGPPSPSAEQTGMVRLTVGGTPSDSVTIVVGGAATASGRVVFEGATPPPPPLTGPIHIPLHSGDGACRQGQARVSADWTFRVEGLSGICSAPQNLTFGRWTLKAVMKGVEDLLDRTITFEPGQQLDGLQLVFTDRRSELVFRVTDDRAQPTREYVVLAYPTDKGRWAEEGVPAVRVFVPPPPAFLQFLQAGATGRAGGPLPADSASVRREALTVPPGDYFVIAVDDVAQEEMRSAALLERLVPSATRVTVAEGAQIDVALRRLELAHVVR